MMKLCTHLFGHGHSYRSLAYARWPIKQERASIGIGHKLCENVLGLPQPDKLRNLARPVLLAEAYWKGKSRGGHWPLPFNGSVWEIWNTVVVHGRRLILRLPVSASVSLLWQSMNVTTLTPCSPRRTTRPNAFHASNVKTFSRGLISDSGIPFAANP